MWKISLTWSSNRTSVFLVDSEETAQTLVRVYIEVKTKSSGVVRFKDTYGRIVAFDAGAVTMLCVTPADGMSE